jgi:hypothetical protein
MSGRSKGDWAMAIDKFLFTEPGKVLLAFVLVVRNHKQEWCRPIKRTIEQALPVYLKKIWQPGIYVINHETAIKHGIAAARKNLEVY